ncbi:unnamed protein product [Ambrosiozyma monospora]|uniref:Unnamed protein product n=1 Tax=Ambrosiozyma monospora TaxID=43982 RepID=A0ACB5UBH7_AMBMO|nr:unnamed protein product [Ambrosiozyma monospora]
MVEGEEDGHEHGEEHDDELATKSFDEEVLSTVSISYPVLAEALIRDAMAGEEAEAEYMSYMNNNDMNVYTFFKFFAQAETYTDDSYTTIPNSEEFSLISNFITSFPWYSTRILPLAQKIAVTAAVTAAEGAASESTESGSATASSATPTSSKHDHDHDEHSSDSEFDDENKSSASASGSDAENKASTSASETSSDDAAMLRLSGVSVLVTLVSGLLALL